MASSIFVKPNTGRIKRRTLPASGEKATFHVKQPGAAGRGGAFCRLRAEISCQGGKALLLYLKGGSGLSQRQWSASKAAVGFKGNGLLQRQWRVAFQAPSAANCRGRSSFKYLCNNQTSHPPLTRSCPQGTARVPKFSLSFAPCAMEPSMCRL